MDIESKDKRVDLVVGRFKRAPKTKEANRLKVPVISIKWIEAVEKEDKLIPFKGYELQ